MIGSVFWLFLLYFHIATSIECSDDECQEDPIKANLLSWYKKWQKGFEVDYITTNELKESYDFIVIGAGIGGSVVAHRLAMDPSHPNVLLLEAGSPSITSAMSSQMTPLQVQLNQLTDIDWQYKSEPSDGYCCEWHKDKRHTIPRGKVMGGSGVLNYMMWVRGHRADWDQLMNVEGWKWNDVLPYFKKVESLRAYDSIRNDTLRGYDGPIKVHSANTLRDKSNIFAESVIEACQDADIPYLETGQNNGNNIGIAYTEYNVDEEGKRHHAFIGYNQYMRRNSKYKKEYEQGRITLHILPYAYVTRILFENDDDKETIAIGVEFVDASDKEKKEYTVRLASKDRGEIILSGGTINTPQLLMLSGIGPKKELNKHNIAVIKDIAGIGGNVQDHTMVWLRYHWKDEYKQHVLTMNKIMNILEDFDLFKEYVLKGRGYLSYTGGGVNAFVKSNMSTETYPDLQLYWVAGFNGITEYLNYRDNVYIEYECGDRGLWDDVNNMQNIVVGVGLQHPDSKGYIKLRSKDPWDHPLIQPNYLKEQRDVDRLKNGVKIIDDIMRKPSLRKLWDFRMDCKKYGDIDTDDEALEHYIRDSAMDIFHLIGSCKMGDIENDEMAVVDNTLRVKGIRNLRIADASVLPFQTSGNTQLPTFMIGEKASDIILKNWNYN